MKAFVRRVANISTSGAPVFTQMVFVQTGLVRWSVLLAYLIYGYIEPIVFQGSIIAEIFEEWLKDHVLPAYCDLGIERVIMNNASIH
jgi:hypothetical protein